MNWLDEYRHKLVSPEEAIAVVTPGDRVAITIGAPEPKTLIEAFAKHKGNLGDIELLTSAPRSDPGWFSKPHEGLAVNLELVFGSVARPALDAKSVDYSPSLFTLRWKAEDEGRPEARKTDVFIVSVSSPDEHGLCSFGQSLWNKRSYARRAKIVLAEVWKDQVRTHGTNFIPVPEIDYFVESGVGPTVNEKPSWLEPTTEGKLIAQHIQALVKDGDTIQIGTGTVTGTLIACGALRGKQDLGIHSELLPPGVVELVKEGIVTGKYKTLHPNKVVTTTCEFHSYVNEDDLAFIDRNPVFELRDVEYVNNIRTVAAHDNMVAINSALAVDLTGQITVETTFGTRLWNGPGGQPEFAIGAMLSKGGRSITVLPATAMNGAVSRIVPVLDEGTKVTIPRTFADMVVTEYGVARLLGRSHRQRAEELINIAHPDFRAELRRQARSLLYP